MKKLIVATAILLSPGLALAESNYVASIVQSVGNFNNSLAVQQAQIAQNTPRSWASIGQYAEGVSNNSIIIQGATINQTGPLTGY
jgi:hypothetical protein